MIKTKLKFWINDRKIKEWANSKNIFFILAIGRSGTKFLADLLDKAPGTLVVHEPIQDDFQAYQEGFHSEAKAEHYIQSLRKKEIYLRLGNQHIDTYGEVNGVLRRHCLALKKEFPNAKFIHLIRDGRDVVRSMISRKTMTVEDPNTKHISPRLEDVWFDKWSEMSRFEKLCWYWQVENRYLRINIQKRVQLEKVIADYEYFQKYVLKPLELEITEDVWRKDIDSPKNVTKEYKIPHWSEWDYDMMQKFFAICGEEMKKNGYEL